MNNISLKVLTKNDWHIYKLLRLQSLSDSPDSFGATFEHESTLTNKEWSARLDYVARKINGLLVVALLNGRPIGLICGAIHAQEDQSGHIYQMWISPEARGLGIGQQLLTHIISWAKNEHVKQLSLAVTTTNIAALKLYQSLGFHEEGDLSELRVNSKLQTHSMILDISTTEY